MLASGAGENPQTKECDVLVVGGGPGGAATAGFLAKRGLDTVLLERESHPRFHVGESLLPRTLPILDELGLLERVHEIGVLKPGAEFVSPDGEVEAIFDFSRALLGGPEHAYQVRRSEFDELLFQRAGELGVRTYEQTAATVEEMTGTGAVVRTEGPEGTRKWKTRFLVDASGRSTLTSKMLSQKRPDPRNTSAAIFGHFRGVPRHPGARGGNIRIHLTNPGWMWQIPLRDGVTSIGMVAQAENMRARNGCIASHFNEHCARHPHLARMIDGAELVGRLHATGNFSYFSTVAWGDSHIKVGDAYGFLDPIFSTGVHLALTGAREASAAIVDSLENPARRHINLRDYDKAVRRRFSFVSWFVYMIHDPAFRHLMLNPRNVLGVEQAVISLLSGDFRPDIRLRARIALFKAIRYMMGKTGRAREYQYAG